MIIKLYNQLTRKAKPLMIALLVILLTWGAIKQYPNIHTATTLLQVLLAIAVAIFAEHAFGGAVNNNSRQSAVISGMLVGMLLVPGVDYKILWLAAVTAIASKYLLKFSSGRHIFNPAATGLMLVSLIWGNKINWWGFTSPYIVIILGGFILYRLKRLSMVFSYYIFRVAGLVALNGLELDSSMLLMPNMFFAFIMLIEPKTSPSVRLEQWIFGCICGLLSSATFILVPSIDGDLASLMVVNLLRPVIKRTASKILNLRTSSMPETVKG